MNRKLLALALVVIVVVLAFVLKPRPTHDATPRASLPIASPAATPDDAPGAAKKSLRESASERTSLRQQENDAEGSLKGTEVAGGLLVDAAGNFVPGPETIALFEYYFSLTGEKSAAEILAAIRDEIRKRLVAPAVAQAEAFLDRYVLYRERGLAMGLAGADEEDLRARFEKLRSLRREVFGEELAKRLFGDEEAETEVAVRQREVAEDPSLSDEEKAAQIEKLNDDLPPAAREARDAALAVVRLRDDEAKIRAAGGGDAEIRALRVERFGEEAADRLEDLDHENAEWDSRFSDYRAERARILANNALPESEKQAALASLLDQRFQGPERIRVHALDELRDEEEKAAN